MSLCHKFAWRAQSGNHNAAVFFKVRWISIGHRGTHLEMALVRFQLCLYHKLESPAQFTSVKSRPRCPHTLDLAQSDGCSGPQACSSVCHCCLLMPHSGCVGKREKKLLENFNPRPKIGRHSSFIVDCG